MSIKTEHAKRYPLRDYQVVAAKRMITDHRLIFADERGVGKTRPTLEATRRLPGFVLVVVGIKVALNVWQEQIKTWTGDPFMIYGGKPNERKRQAEEFAIRKPKYVITNTAMMEEALDLAYFQTLVIDEYHRIGLMNRKSKIFKLVHNACNVSGHIPNVFFLSGTPRSKSPADLWGPLHILYPRQYSSYWKFRNMHCVEHKNFAGFTVLESRPADAVALNAVLRPHMIRRKLRQVQPEMAQPIRNFIPVDMTAAQKEAYKDLAKEAVAMIGDQVVITPNKIVNLIRLRQLLVSPQILGGDTADLGAAIPVMLELVQEELDDGKPIVIYTPFRAGVDLIEKQLYNYFNDREEPIEIFCIKGGSGSESSTGIAEDFQNSKNARRILVGTIKSAISYTATASSHIIFMGAEYSHIDMEQAEGRIDRFTQENVARFTYIVHKKTVEEEVFRRVHTNLYWSEISLNVEDLLVDEMRKVSWL